MLQQKEQHQARSSLYDSGSAYGWISILMHWATAIVIIVLWFFGNSITSALPDDAGALRHLHVSIAASAWLLILARVVWRFRSGHPLIKGQTLFVHRVATVAHYTMLIALLFMLVSGPLMVWSSGNPITIFNWLSIPGLIDKSDAVREFALFIHSNSAWLIFWLTLLHVAGALKHLMFHADDTIARMIWPGKRQTGTE